MRAPLNLENHLDCTVKGHCQFCIEDEGRCCACGEVFEPAGGGLI